MQVRVCDSSQDAVKNDASPSATCAIVSSESIAEINANFFGDDKPGIPILLVENPQALRDLGLQESPFSQAEEERSTPALSRQHSVEQVTVVSDVKNEPPTPTSTPVLTDSVPPVSALNIAAPNGLSFNPALFTSSSSSPAEDTESKSNLASLVSAASQLLTTHSPLVTLKEEQNGSLPEATRHPEDDETDDTAAAAAAILLFKGDCPEANLILGLPGLHATEEDALTFSCHEEEIPAATTPEANATTSPFQANVGDVMDQSSGSLEYDSNPPPSSTGSTNSSATEVVGVSVSLAGTGSTSSSHRGRGAGNGASMPGSGASAGSGNGVELPDTKEGIEELCPVCGDKVSGYHYGLLTCESCKGFFKRTVQNKKVYTCVADRSCHIDKSQRKRCPFCRFQKCLEVGMKLEAVRADRMRGGRNKFGPMYKRDRARKLQTIREKQLRPGGASTPSSQSSNGGSTPSSQAGLYATDSNLYSVSGQPSTTSVPLYVTGGGIKHEIQIPQVSSLTSSPDSSPSPLGMPATSYASHSSTGNLGAANTSLGSEKPLWNNNNTPGNLNNPASNHPNTPSPTHQHPHLSPKQFQFDGLLGSSSTSGSSLGAGLTGLSSGTSPGATPIAKMPPLVREFVQSLDDKEWQSALFGLLQSQSYNQVEVDLFELLCKVLDQNLFSQVDWARNSVFFKDLRVDDQMKMLQHSWSDLLILDHIHQRMHNHLPDETTLPNGQKFELVSLAMLGAPELAEPLHDLTRRLQEIRFDVPDYICLKFLLLLNPDVRGLMNRRHVVEAHDQVQQALFDYTLNCYPQVPDKFSKLLAILPDVHSISSRGEDFLYFKHLNGFAPTQTLLMEMLHAKRR